MKTVAILIPTLKPGGAEKQATILATLLDKYYNVDLYLLSGIEQASSQNLELLSNSRVRLHSMNGNVISKIFQLKKLLKNNKTDILLNYLTSCDTIGALAGCLANVERVFGGIRNTRIEWPKMIIEKIVHNYLSSGTIYNCYSGAEYFASKGYKLSKNIVIPNCFLNIAQPIARNNMGVKHIVTVGRFVPQKDYNTLIKTVACLKKINKDFVIDIVGYGIEEQNIYRWIKEYDVADCINVYISPDNVQDIVQDADIYLSTSLFEGTSNSIMEALNWSLPVVATDVGDNNRLVIEGKNGMLHSIGDAEGMAKSISRLLNNDDLRVNFGIASNQNLRDNYSIETFEKKYLALINTK